MVLARGVAMHLDVFVYIIGCAVQLEMENNWMKKILKTDKIGLGHWLSPIWQSEEFL